MVLDYQQVSHGLKLNMDKVCSWQLQVAQLFQPQAQTVLIGLQEQCLVHLTGQILYLAIQITYLYGPQLAQLLEQPQLLLILALRHKEE